MPGKHVPPPQPFPAPLLRIDARDRVHQVQCEVLPVRLQLRERRLAQSIARLRPHVRREIRLLHAERLANVSNTVAVASLHSGSIVIRPHIGKSSSQCESNRAERIFRSVLQ